MSAPPAGRNTSGDASSVYGTVGADAHPGTKKSASKRDDGTAHSRNRRSPGIGPGRLSRALAIFEFPDDRKSIAHPRQAQNPPSARHWIEAKSLPTGGTLPSVRVPSPVIPRATGSRDYAVATRCTFAPIHPSLKKGLSGVTETAAATIDSLYFVAYTRALPRRALVINISNFLKT
jgi:hypothetical protein